MAGKMLSELYPNSEGFYSIEIEWKKKWYSLSDHDQSKYIAYLKGIHQFSTEPETVSDHQKRWLLRNADIETDIIPLHIHKKYSLSSGESETESVK